jgi:hypothetical protein
MIVLFQVKEVALPARKRNARLSFAFVYPDKNGRFVVRQVRVYSSFFTYLAITASSLHLQVPHDSLVPNAKSILLRMYQLSNLPSSKKWID